MESGRAILTTGRVPSHVGSLCDLRDCSRGSKNSEVSYTAIIARPGLKLLDTDLLTHILGFLLMTLRGYTALVFAIDSGS